MSDPKYTNISQLRSASVSQYIFNTFVLLWIASPMRQGAYQRPSPMQKRKRLTWPGLFSLPATWNYPHSMLLLPDDPMSKYLLWWSCAQTKILHNTDAKSLISHQIGQNITNFFFESFLWSLTVPMLENILLPLPSTIIADFVPVILASNRCPEFATRGRKDQIENGMSLPLPGAHIERHNLLELI